MNNLLQKEKDRPEAQRAREPEIVLAFEISVSVSFRKYSWCKGKRRGMIYIKKHS